MKLFRIFSVAMVLIASASVARADLVDRWTSTATNSSLNRGDAATITWSIVRDGPTISDSFSSSPSDLVAFFDDIIGDGGGGSDLTQRPWFSLFEDSFNRWAEVSGITYVYEPNDDGQGINGNSNPLGELGVRGDVRIGGHGLDGQSGSNVLAYNYYPNHGDMVIDTDNTSFYASSSNDFRSARNVIMHEAGHGIGLDHRESSDTNFLMEPFINTSFDGPQFDDILSAQRGYGDVHEKNGGNDTSATATSLGQVANNGTVSIGDDADDAVVASTDVDFISIDGTSDADFLSFTVNGEGILDLVLNPMGPTYQKGPQGGQQSSFDASAQSDLMLELFDTDGVTLLATADDFGLGESEFINDFAVDGGTYFVRISGQNDLAQFYQFQASFSAVPEPSSVLALTAMGIVAGLYVRRRKRKAETQES